METAKSPFDIPSVNDYIHMFNAKGIQVVFADWTTRMDQMTTSAEYTDIEDTELQKQISDDINNQYKLLQDFIYYILEVEQKIQFSHKKKLFWEAVQKSHFNSGANFADNIYKAINKLLPCYLSN